MTDYQDTSSDIRKATRISEAARKMRNDPASTQQERMVMDELLGLPVNSLAILHDALIHAKFITA